MSFFFNCSFLNFRILKFKNLSNNKSLFNDKFNHIKMYFENLFLRNTSILLYALIRISLMMFVTYGDIFCFNLMKICI